jgi:hypothetical protein
MTGLFLAALLGASTPESGHHGPVWSYAVDQNNHEQPVVFRVTQNVITAVHFNYPVVAEDVLCGNTTSVKVLANRDNTQLNFTALAQAKAGFRTNCNVPFANGLSFPMWIDVVDKGADTFADITMALKPSADQKPKQSQADQDVISNAIEDYKLKADTVLAEEAASSVISKSLRDKAEFDDILISAEHHVKIGPLGIVRFSIDNQSRTAWPSGDVKIAWYLSGHDPEKLKSSSACKDPIVDRGQQTACAVVFKMYSLPADAKFVIQIFEKNGTRHPKLDGLRL